MKVPFMKRALLFGIVLFLACHNLYSQGWSYFKDFPINTAPKDLEINNAGTLFLLSEDFRIFYKTQSGDWTIMLNGTNSGGSGFHPVSPLCISVDKNSDRLYVGDQFSGGIYYTSDFGLNWGQNFVTTDMISGFHETVDEISNIPLSSIFFGTSLTGSLSADIIKYTSLGTVGQILTYDGSGNLNYLPSKLFYTSNEKLLIGTDNGGIFITENNGLTFQHTNQNQHRIISFAEDDAGTVYALGEDILSETFFLISSQDYISWTLLTLPNATEDFRTLAFDSNSQTLWLGSNLGIYKSAVSLLSWTDASFNSVAPHTIEIVSNTNDGVHTITSQYVVQQLSDDEVLWQSINSGLTGSIDNFKFNEADKLFAANKYFSNNISFVDEMSFNWVNTYLESEMTTGVRDFYTDGSDKVYATTLNSIWRSTDSGVSFSDITPAGVPGFITLFYFGKNGGLFFTNSIEPDHLYYSADEGTSWQLMHVFPSYSTFSTDPITDVAQDANGVVYVTLESMDNFDNGSKVYYSTDNGATWQTKIYTDPNLASISSEVFSAGNSTYLNIGNNLFKFNYSLPDDNFIAIPLPTVFVNESISLVNLAIDDDNGTIYLFGYDLYASTNEGASWVNFGKPANLAAALIDNLTLDDNGSVYISYAQPSFIPNVGFVDGIYKFEPTLQTGQNQIENSVIVYPNPVNDQLFISNTHPNTTVHLTNSAGQLVYSCVAQTGTMQIQLSGLEPGVYFLQLTSENGSIEAHRVVVAN